MKKLSVCLLVFCLMLSVCSMALAAKKNGALIAEDFSFKGVPLGATYEEMTAVLGEPDFDTDTIVLDERVKTYVYSSDLRVSVDPRNEKVVAFFCKDKDFQARDGVTYGATRAKLIKTYGKYDTLKRDGELYYVYRNPEDEHQKLIFDMETSNYYVQSILVTSLPITEEEAADYDLGEFPDILDETDDEPKLNGGFNSKGEWWTSYKIGGGATIGIGN